MDLKVRVINKSNSQLPAYETKGAAGLDLKACLLTERENEPNVFDAYDETIEVGQRKLIKTGLFLEIPQGYEAQVRPRSGLALKNGITVLNSPGTVDSDYRGEIGVIIINHGDNGFVINHGDRIAQLVFNKVEQAEWDEVDSLEETERGEGGFGSTGK
jgi:dUTP pyrophosphatase